MKKVRRNQSCITKNSCIELSATQFFLVSIIKEEHLATDTFITLIGFENPFCEFIMITGHYRNNIFEISVLLLRKDINVKQMPFADVFQSRRF